MCNRNNIFNRIYSYIISLLLITVFNYQYYIFLFRYLEKIFEKNYCYGYFSEISLFFIEKIVIFIFFKTLFVFFYYFLFINLKLI